MNANPGSSMQPPSRLRIVVAHSLPWPNEARVTPLNNGIFTTQMDFIVQWIIAAVAAGAVGAVAAATSGALVAIAALVAVFVTVRYGFFVRHVLAHHDPEAT